MKQEVVDKAFSYIDALAEKLNVASEQVFAIMIKRVYIDVFVSISSTLILIVLAVVLWKILMKHYNKEDENLLFEYRVDIREFDDLTGFGVVYTIALGVIVSLAVVGIILIPQDIAKLFNPEYHALKNVFDLINNK